MKYSKFLNEQIYRVLIFSMVLGVVFFAGVLLPRINQIRDLKRQEDLAAGHRRVLDDLKSKIAVVRKGPRLVDLNGASKVVQEIADIGAKHSVLFLTFQQRDNKRSKDKKLNTLPVELDATSTYRQLGDFMSQLNGLESGIVLIDSFQIAGDAKDPDKVRASINMQICLKKEGNGKK